MAPVHFFKSPPFYYVPAVVIGMTLCTIVAAAPDVIPYDSLWHVGTFLRVMAYDYSALSLAICVSAWISHVVEACYAYSICRKLHLTNEDTVKWTLQTFTLGFLSLGLLKAKLNCTV